LFFLRRIVNFVGFPPSSYYYDVVWNLPLCFFFSLGA
jgi:hypothetical protein